MFVRRFLVFVVALAPVFLAPAAHATTRLSRPVRMVRQSLHDIAAAKPGSDAALPAFLRGAVADVPPPGFSLAPGAGEPVLTLLVVTGDGGASLRAAGFDVGTQAGEVSIVRAPLSRLDELETLEHVGRVDLSKPLQPNLDVSRIEVNGDEANGATMPPYPPTGLTGQGVCIGVVDSGIDFTNSDFDDESGNTRIQHLWDQTDNGVSPGKPAGFTYGTEWTAANIDAGIPRERDFIGHGSHVTGIAAGDGSETGNGKPAFTYIGIAPEAEIIAVKTTFQSDAIVDGISFIQQRAGAKASVVNLSLGSQFGPHDGTDSFDLAMRGLSGPGKIIVAAAGNEGDIPIHAEATVAGGATMSFPVSISPYTPTSGGENDIIWIEAWYPGGRTLQFTLKSPNNAQTLGPISVNDSDGKVTADGALYIENAVEQTNNGDRLATLNIFDDRNNPIPPKAGTWTIEVKNTSAQAAEVDLWISLSQLVDASGFPTDVDFTANVDFAELVSTPATSDSVIAVGAYCTKRSWTASNNQNVSYTSPTIQVGRLAPFSSPGPRRDGMLKPEISAPGIGIGSAISVSANPTGDPLSLLPDLKHIINQGTSQASPHVAGAVALILQNHPQYARKEVLEALTTTARSDVNTGAVPNAMYGYGKLDVKAAIDHVVPVRLLSLATAWEDGRAVVRWSLAETEPGTVFRVERGAAAGGPFTAVSDALLGELEFSWTDPAPDAAEPWYRVRGVLRTGAQTFFGPVRLEPGTTPVALLQNAPNPFTASTVIAFELPSRAPVLIEIVDVQGRVVRTLLREEMDAGRHELAWEGRTEDGRRAASGVYFTRMVTPASVLVKRMVLTD